MNSISRRPTDAAAPLVKPTSPWVWLHQSLMPDYNRKAAAYWWTVVMLGLASTVYSAVSVAMLPSAALAQTLAGVAIAMVSGYFPVRIGRSKISFSGGEVFIILLLPMHGPAAATLAVLSQ